MAIKFGFFNSVNGDRKYTADDIGKYLMGIISSGVYADNPNSLRVLNGDEGGMTVTVQPGRAMLHYHYMENDSPLTLTLEPGETAARIDAIVARLDMGRRLCEIAVVKGTPAAAPVRPTMARTDTVKEYMLASVYVSRLATYIADSEITDTRWDTSVCGYVTGIIDQVDTSALFDQWKAAYDEAVTEMDAALASQQQTFEDWFAALTDNFEDGTGLPIPSPDDVDKILTVNGDGNGYYLRPADKTLTVPGFAADAEATGAAIKKARPVNLLDNSDFTKPVNCTGFAGGKPEIDNAYIIDKWQAQQSAAKNVEFNFSDSGLIIHVSTALAGIKQRISKPKTGVTFAAKVNGQISFVYSRHGEDESIKTADNILLYVEWLNDALQVIIRNSGDGEKEYTVEWTALYEGEYTANTLPEYQPRGYSLEAAACNAPPIELLWENASPSSQFAGQKLTIPNVHLYKALIVEYCKGNSSGSPKYVGTAVCSVKALENGERAEISSFAESTGYFYKRYIMAVDENSLTFGSCGGYLLKVGGYSTTNTPNNILVPFRIYGLK